MSVYWIIGLLTYFNSIGGPSLTRGVAGEKPPREGKEAFYLLWARDYILLIARFSAEIRFLMKQNTSNLIQLLGKSESR